MTSEPRSLERVQRHPDHALAVPTSEHFLPLAYVAGLCDAAGEAAQPFAEGRTLGSLSMTSYLLGIAVPPSVLQGELDQSLPVDVAPEQTNT
jgi:4,5-DOPA dioxygenase extradiol